MSTLTFHSLCNDTQDSETIAQNIEKLNEFTLMNLWELVKEEGSLFGSSSLEVFAHINLGLIFNKTKCKFEWMVNEVEQMPNASLWILDKAKIDSDIPKVTTRNLSNYLHSEQMARACHQAYTAQDNGWWKLCSILLEDILSVEGI
jgi:hypothetical protein